MAVYHAEPPDNTPIILVLAVFVVLVLAIILSA